MTSLYRQQPVSFSSSHMAGLNAAFPLPGQDKTMEGVLPSFLIFFFVIE